MPQHTLNTPREETHQRIADALEDIVNKIVDTSSASNIDYDNTQSGLSANKVQGAVDELASEKADKSTTLAGYGITDAYTKAEVYTQSEVNNIVSTLETNIDWNASAIEDIQEDISTSQTATGNPITIESSESNLVECVAEVEAVQDLHGYDKPWVGGAGKNKSPLILAVIKTENTDGTWSGNTYTLNDVTFTVNTDNGENVTGITVNGTASATTVLLLYNVPSYFVVGTQYVVSGCFAGGSAETYKHDMLRDDAVLASEYGSGVTVTANSTFINTNVRERIVVYSGVTLNNAEFLPMLRLSTETDSSFAPYSNISPISGRTEENIVRVGVNLFDGVWSNGYIDTTTGEIVSSSYIKYHDYIKIKSSQWYTFSAYDLHDVSNAFQIFGYDSNKNYIGIIIHNTIESATTRFAEKFQTPNNVAYIRIHISTTTLGTSDKQQLEYGETYTTYEPYKGKTYTIQLGDTIYGGELDVVTGEMVVTKGIERVDDSWTYTSWSGKNYIRKAIEDIYTDTPRVDPISSMCQFDGYGGVNIFQDGKLYQAVNGSDIYISDNNCTNKTDFLNVYAGCEIVYELATPYTIQLTPQQIRLLKGTNNISCNTGDLSIKYYPDNVLGQLKGDIEGEYDERITELEEKANTPTIKQVEINRNAVSTDGSVMFTSLTGHIIVGTSISNDANGDKCVGIPYSMGNVPSLKIMNESTMAVLPNITISGTLYCIKL